MTGYVELSNLPISHPYIDAGAWSMIPGAQAERYLALSGLKAAFSRGRLSLRGAADFPDLLFRICWLTVPSLWAVVKPTIYAFSSSATRA
jgi:hypothetical protein